jgi:hypothetical protein
MIRGGVPLHAYKGHPLTDDKIQPRKYLNHLELSAKWHYVVCYKLAKVSTIRETTTRTIRFISARTSIISYGGSRRLRRGHNPKDHEYGWGYVYDILSDQVKGPLTNPNNFNYRNEGPSREQTHNQPSQFSTASRCL